MVSPRDALGRLFELAVMLTRSMDRGLAEQGLTRARAEVMWRLGLLGPMTQRELSDALRCTPRNVTGLVDALEAAELVVRGPHPSDRRATLVTLTEAGAAIVTAWLSNYEDLAHRLFTDIRSGDVARFVATLDLVIDRLREADRFRDQESPLQQRRLEPQRDG